MSKQKKIDPKKAATFITVGDLRKLLEDIHGNVAVSVMGEDAIANINTSGDSDIKITFDTEPIWEPDERTAFKMVVCVLDVSDLISILTCHADHCGVSVAGIIGGVFHIEESAKDGTPLTVILDTECLCDEET